MVWQSAARKRLVERACEPAIRSGVPEKKATKLVGHCYGGRTVIHRQPDVCDGGSEKTVQPAGGDEADDHASACRQHTRRATGLSADTPTCVLVLAHELQALTASTTYNDVTNPEADQT